MLRLASMAFLLAGLNGCAVLPTIALNLASQGAQALAALALGPLDAAKERSETDRCLASANKGIVIGESLETTIPTGERNVEAFEPASWRTEFARDGYPTTERSGPSIEATLSVSEKSVYFVPEAGAITIRIPYELIQGVDVRNHAGTNDPDSLIVKSCNGRFDIVVFWKQRPGMPDPVAITAAAVQLKTRLAAFRAAKAD
ncbi:MAG: hypothetical protein ABI724_14475 [Betaproteobacteria bacterium]